VKHLFLAVSYGSSEHAKSFGGLFREARLDHRLALVDNTQGDARGRLEREFQPASERIRCFTAPDNLGYFGGMRYALGLDWVREYSADWTVISNVDVRFDPDAVAATLARLDPDGIACVAPAVVSQLSGADQNPFMRVRPTRLRMVFYKYLFRWYWGLAGYTWFSELARGNRGGARKQAAPLASTSLQIYAPHGSLMILGRGFFSRGGSLAHEPFLYGEEITIGERARELRLPVMYVPEIRVEHAEHVSTSSLPSRLRHRFQSESARLLADRYFS
jgi:GT2 family glycosyltransferase